MLISMVLEVIQTAHNAIQPLCDSMTRPKNQRQTLVTRQEQHSDKSQHCVPGLQPFSFYGG